MSRSYKKEPVCKDSTRKGSTFKSGKQLANSAVRHKTDCPNRGGYRKMYCSYNISDYSFRMDERDLRRGWENPDGWMRKQFPSYRLAYIWWMKWYRRK